ncbi:MAG: PhoH family protein [Flavobacteriales bacterium]
MQEKEFILEEVSLLDLFGANEKKLTQVKKYFPKLKIVVRGNVLKASGDEETIQQFERKLNVLIHHVNKYNRLEENEIERIILQEDHYNKAKEGADGVLVFGNSGTQVKAQTANQRLLVLASEKNDMVFAVGPAGSGKTYTAVALAVRALKNKEVRRIVLTRPAVEAGENLGFLPGDLKEKLDPYMQPLYDALTDMIPAEKLKEYVETGVIQIAPLAFMRGRTLDKSFVILDEAQNATVNQMRMFLTRMGKTAKFIITGDMTQIDLPKNQKSGLVSAINVLKDVNGIEVITLDGRDVIRHPLVKKIISAYEKFGEQSPKY